METTGTPDTVVFREAAATIQLGADVNGAAVPQTFKAHDGITGTDIAGANLTIAGGRGTGAGAPGNLIFQTATALGTGTTAQTLADRLTISPTAVTSAVPVLLPDGAPGAPAVAFSSDADGTGTGLYRQDVNSIGFATNGSGVAALDGSRFRPATDNSYQLGYTTLKWSDAFIGSSFQGSRSKALTDATATAFVRVSVAQTIATNYEAGEVRYTIYCDNDTNQAVQKGSVKFACHNLAGTEACSFSTPDAVTLGDGTASLGAAAFDASSGSANTIDLRVSSDCTGITPNTHTIEYFVTTEATVTLTPQ